MVRPSPAVAPVTTLRALVFHKEGHDDGAVCTLLIETPDFGV